MPDHPADWPHYSFAGVREQTAELANIALLHGTPPRPPLSARLLDDPNHDVPSLKLSSRPIVSVRSTSHARDLFESSRSSSYTRHSASPSHLSYLFRKDQASLASPSGGAEPSVDSVETAPSERDPLLLSKKHYGTHEDLHSRENEVLEEPGTDLESQVYHRANGAMKKTLMWPKGGGLNAVKTLFNCPKLNAKDVWNKGVAQPITYLPAVFLGLLLNVLDGLSYGKFRTFLVKLSRAYEYRNDLISPGREYLQRPRP